MDVYKLEQQLNLNFNDKKLLKQAFTHSSYVNEHRDKPFSDNERLEFLGDAVLELGVSKFLYKIKPKLAEGDMTKLRAAIVCEPSLTKFAKELKFGDYLLLGRGEEQTGGRERAAILADVFEAFLGAVYLDLGYEEAIDFLDTHILQKINIGAFSHAMDYKSQLQEIVQQKKNQRISYQIVEERGPSHDKEFVAQVLINDKVIKKGVGKLPTPCYNKYVIRNS